MTNKRVRIFFVWIALLVLALPAKAQQRFFNLTADEVKVDSVLPHFLYSIPLPENYQDSVYTVSVKYPEYMDMTVSDVANYNRISGAALPSQVPLSQNISVSRRKGYLVASFCPLVFRNNKYQMLVSFMLDVKAKAVKNSVLRQRKNDKAYASAADIYAEHSLLASGKWAKIRVSSSGVYQLTEATVRQAGFSNINKVKIYGYGGNLQNEALYANDFNTKLNQTAKFLAAGHKVKASIRFRGREMAHSALGADVLKRFAEALPQASMDKPPVLEGRTMSILLIPKPNKD